MPDKQLRVKEEVVLKICDSLQHCSTKEEVIRVLIEGVQQLGFSRARVWLKAPAGEVLLSCKCTANHSCKTAFEAGQITIRSDDRVGQLTVSSQKTQRFRYAKSRYHRSETQFEWVDVERITDPHLTILEKEDVSEWIEMPLAAGNHKLGNISIDNKGTDKRLLDMDVVLLNQLAIVASVVLHSIEAIRQMSESRRDHLRLLESIPAYIFCKDLNGRFTYVNRRLCELFAKTENQIYGKTDFDFFPAELAEKYERDDREVRQSQIVLEIEEEFVRPDGGGKMFIQVVKIPTYASDGSVNGVQGVFLDISSRREVEEMEKAHEIARFGHWKWVLDAAPGRQQVFPSPGFYQIFDFDPNDKSLNLQAVRKRIHPDDVDEWDKLFRAVMESREGFAASLRVLDRNGGKVTWVQAKARIVRWNQQHRPQIMIGFVQDITSSKSSQDILTLAAVACAGVHELASPVRDVRNKASRLKETVTQGGKIYRGLREIEEYHDQFLSTIEDFIDVFRTGDIEKCPIQIGIFEEGCFGRAKTFFPNCEVEFHDKTSIININFNLIRYAFYTIINNTKEHVPNCGKFRICVKPSENRMIKFEFKDNGPGFPPNVLDAFRLVSVAERRDKPGRGLGLLIARAIVELHDGKMDIRNQDGALITILIPASN